MRAEAWTPGLDGRLLSLRAAGASWDSIAVDLRLGRYTVVERGRRLGARKTAQPAPAMPIEARDRPPLQAGHPACWGLITAGTVLEGTPYPYPVFL
jgi:hypothetical protein